MSAFAICILFTALGQEVRRRPAWLSPAGCGRRLEGASSLGQPEGADSFSPEDSPEGCGAAQSRTAALGGVEGGGQ